MKNTYKWVFPATSTDKKLFSEVKKAAGSTILTKLLINRGITSYEEALAFLDTENASLTSPYIFPDMEKAVERIKKAVQDKEHIVVFGDFDADGVTSTALLYKTLKIIGADSSFYLPGRLAEGHGLNSAIVCRLISSRKAKIIITVDCGISNVPEIKLASSLGTDVIITDHHEPQEELPESFAIINPKTLDPTPENKGIKYLAGVGTAYKLACALLEAYGKEDSHDDIFYFAAIGTIADVVPLLGENRTIVHRGIKLLSQKRPPSIGKILQIGGHKPTQKISAGVVAFGIAPRINAMGRLSDASPLIDFLLSEDEEELSKILKTIDQNNKTRQDMGEETFLQAEQKIHEELDLKHEKSVILADKNWHPGIIGIIASKIVEKYHRPVLLVSIDEEKNQARGSARSIPGLNLFETLNEFSEFFIQFGGHALAAGFTFDLQKMSFEQFRGLIGNYINMNLPAEALKPELRIDAELKPEELTEDFIKEIEKLEPFGEANPSPVFCMTNLSLIKTQKMGQKKNHMKLFLMSEVGTIFEAVWWKKEGLDIAENEKVDVAFSSSLNNFMDKISVQLIIKDLKRSSEKELPLGEEELAEKILEEELPIEEIIEEILEETTVEAQETISTEIKWHDMRNSTGIKREFMSYIKSLGENAAFFAETPKALDIISSSKILKPIRISRVGNKKVKSLVLLDSPPCEKTFFSLLETFQPEEVYLIALKAEISPVETVKKLSGMLKYAFREKQGVLKISAAASFLALSDDAIVSALEMFESAGCIEVLSMEEESIKFRFLESVSLSQIISGLEYQVFSDTIQECENFKIDIASADIEKISKTFLPYRQGLYTLSI